jgi:hypothetical protein
MPGNETVIQIPKTPTAARLEEFFRVCGTDEDPGVRYGLRGTADWARQEIKQHGHPREQSSRSGGWRGQLRLLMPGPDPARMIDDGDPFTPWLIRFSSGRHNKACVRAADLPEWGGAAAGLAYAGDDVAYSTLRAMGVHFVPCYRYSLRYDGGDGMLHHTHHGLVIAKTDLPLVAAYRAALVMTEAGKVRRPGPRRFAMKFREHGHAEATADH